MSGHDLAKHGPFTVTIDFCLTDGEQVAKASFECPPGELPTEEQIEQAAENTARQVRSQLGDHFRWQTRHEFLQDAMAEHTGGMRLSVPCPNTFEMEWAK